MAIQIHILTFTHLPLKHTNINKQDLDESWVATYVNLILCSCIQQAVKFFGKSFRQETYSYSVAKFCQYMKRWKYFNFNLLFPPNPLHSGWHFRRSGLKLCLWVKLYMDTDYLLSISLYIWIQINSTLKAFWRCPSLSPSSSPSSSSPWSAASSTWSGRGGREGRGRRISPRSDARRW